MKTTSEYPMWATNDAVACRVILPVIRAGGMVLCEIEGGAQWFIPPGDLTMPETPEPTTPADQ